MTKGVITGILSTLRAYGSRSEYQQSSAERQPTVERPPSGEVTCAVVTCPRCGRQRPYSVSPERFAAGHETYRLEQGLDMHLSIRHDLDEAERDGLTVRTVAEAEVRELPETLVEEVEDHDRKWREYDL